MVVWRHKERWYRWGVLAIVAFGGALRIPFFTARSLWFDEAFSWRLIDYLPSAEFFARAAADVHPVLYYLLLWLWMLPARLATQIVGWPAPEFTLLWMRLLSVLLGAVTVAAMIYAGRVLFRSRLTGLAAGLLTAVNAFELQYAWEARMYTLGTALLPLAMATLVRAWEARSRRSAWRAGLGFGLSLGALLHVHYYALFSWLALGVAKFLGLLARVPRGVRHLVASANVRAAETGFWLSALLFIPWLPVFLVQTSRVQTAFWIPQLTLRAIPATVARLFWGGTSEPSLLWVVAAILAAVALVLVSLIRGRSFGDLVAAASFAIPILASVIVSLRTSIFLDRYFLFASLGLILLLARAIGFLPPRLRLSALSICVGLGLISVTRFWQQLDFPAHPGARAAASYLTQRSAPDEPVLVSSPFVYFPVAFHIGCSARGTHCPQGRLVRLFAEGGELIHFAGGPILAPGDLATFEDFRDSRRLWVVDTTGFGGSRLSMREPYTLTSEVSFSELFPYQGELVVREYVRHTPVEGSLKVPVASGETYRDRRPASTPVTAASPGSAPAQLPRPRSRS